MKKIMLVIFVFSASLATAADWPIYKGNILFTGNNDEVTVKNGNLKWMYQAPNLVYFPIVSDGKVYFLDLAKNLYCLNEDKGNLLWKADIQQVSSQFRAASKSGGKIKYPLIMGNNIYLSDAIAIYCLDKITGKVVWARTGMRDDRELELKKKSWKDEKAATGRFSVDKKFAPAGSAYATVDGIYSDPVIANGRIYYGTRNVFIARDIANGRLVWDNDSIKSYSGFPSYYDDYVFTQSMDYSTGAYVLYCIAARNGTVAWSKHLEKPFKVFSPVIYRQKVYMPIGGALECYSLTNGETLWRKDFGETITSNPGFSEREIILTLGNRRVVMINPDDGTITSSIDLGEQSSPYFVIIRDQVYIASAFTKIVTDREVPFTSLRALRFGGSAPLWQFSTPFPGGPHQPAASNGILFQPAGNYLYAVGTDYYPRIVEGGSALYDPYNTREDPGGAPGDIKPAAPVKDGAPAAGAKKETEPETRKIRLTVADTTGVFVPAEIDVRKWEEGKPVYSKKTMVTLPGQEIEIPNGDGIEITASAPGFVPKKIILPKNDSGPVITLDKMEKGKEIVIENIHFEINEAYLRRESLNILDRLADAMKRNGRITIEIRGHTDSTGTRQHNLTLSRRRADAVVDYLIKNGISPERLSARGFGPDKPIGDNATADGRRKNRRTEISVTDM